MVINKNVYPFLFLYTLLVYVLGMLLVPMMEIDSAQYASISEQMLRQHSYLQIRYLDGNYLDKPPLLFWLAAISMHFLGFNSFAYKLPSVLATGLAVYSTFRYTRLYYSLDVAKAAALILVSCLAFFVMSNDCRTDNLLIGFCCFSIWKMASGIQSGKNIDLYFGFAGIGFAMLAKGPLGLVFPFFTIGCTLFGNKNTMKMGWAWLWSIPIIAVILIPMCIGLYQQYGLKGLEFYFWTQSFGRITGQSEWINDSGPLYLVHTFLWCFIPFTLIFFLALCDAIKKIIMKEPKHSSGDFGTLGGLILTFIALSFSRYKLPHYIYIICPFASILTADYVLRQIQNTLFLRRLFWIQFIMVSLLAIVVSGVVVIFSELSVFWIVLLSFLMIMGAGWLINFSWLGSSLITASVFISISANLMLNTLFYPKLLTYQSSSEAAFYIRDKMIPVDHVIAYKKYGYGLSYYLHQDIPREEDLNRLKPGLIVYTDSVGLDELIHANILFHIIKKFDDFHVSALNLQFLNPTTRKLAISEAFLLKIDE